jgi:RHS repeat-associated protein
VRENTGVDVINYVYTDHLGSIVSVTNETGSIIAEQNFDAWGRNRNPNNWTYNSVPTAPVWLYRGYTGHEHLPVFGLINMNGRLYDPIVGRMLSVDNFVHGSGTSTQGFNRYSYVLNNPLRYKDPSGENPILLGAALIGGVANVWVNWDKIDNFKEGLSYFGIGALGGLMAVTPGFQTTSVGMVATLNITADAIYGNTPQIDNTSDAVSYLTKSGLDALSTTGAAQLANTAAYAISRIWVERGIQTAMTSVEIAEANLIFAKARVPGTWASTTSSGVAASGKIVTTLAKEAVAVVGEANVNILTKTELQAIVKAGDNPALLRTLFGNGKNSQAVLDNIGNVKVPDGLTRETMQAYRSLIDKVPDPTGTQAIRKQILDILLKI